MDEEKTPTPGRTSPLWMLAYVVCIGLGLWVQRLFTVAGHLIAMMIIGLPPLVYALVFYRANSEEHMRELDVEPDTGRIVIPRSILQDIDERYSPESQRTFLYILAIPVVSTAASLLAISYVTEPVTKVFYAAYPLFAPIAELTGAVDGCLSNLNGNDTDIRLSAYVINTAICFLSGLGSLLCVFSDFNTILRVNYLKKIRKITTLGKTRSIFPMILFLIFNALFDMLIVFTLYIGALNDLYCANDSVINKKTHIIESFIFSSSCVFGSGMAISSFFLYIFIFTVAYKKYCSGFSYKDFVIK